MKVKLRTRDVRGKKVLYLDYMENEKRVRKMLNLPDTHSNVNYVHRNIIPQIERKLENGLRLEGYKLSEFTDILLKETKEEKKTNTFLLYTHAIEKFFKFMGDVDVERTRIKDIDKYVKLLVEDGMASSTISLYLVPIKLAFKEAMRIELIRSNPVHLVKKPKVRKKEKRPFTLLQMHHLLDKADGTLKVFLYFAFFTGARANEILALNWIDIADKHISISKTFANDNSINSPKNGKSRRVAMLKPLDLFLEEQTKGRPNERIISSCYQTIRLKFKKLLMDLGYEKNSLHVTRHTFTSLLMQSRENPTLIQYFLGHSSLEMINKVYAHYIEDDSDVTRMEKVLEL